MLEQDARVSLEGSTHERRLVGPSLLVLSNQGVSDLMRIIRSLGLTLEGKLVLLGPNERMGVFSLGLKRTVILEMSVEFLPHFLSNIRVLVPLSEVIDARRGLKTTKSQANGITRC